MLGNSSRTKKRSMARETTKRPISRTKISDDRELLGFVPERFRSAVWIVLLLVSLFAFFSGPIFGGEYMGADDNVSWEAYRPYLAQVDDAGESPQWMPYVFSGMPGVAAFMVTGDRNWDLSMSLLHGVQSVFSVVNADVTRILFYYFLLGFGVFMLLRRKGVSRAVSFFGAFATIFSTWIIVWIMIGHNTKPMVLAFLPWVILFADELIERWSLISAGLLILAVHFLLESAHPQTALYCAFIVIIWLLSELVASLKRSDKDRTAGIVRSILVGGAAAIFAVGMGWDRYSVSLFEYNDYSTRGAAPLFDELQGNQDPYEYATSWSQDVDEMFTYVVPSYFGFGKLELDVPGLPSEPIPTYWGNERAPFTDAGHYMGILVLILALFGLVRRWRDPFVLGLGLAGLLGVVLSFGGNMPLLYNLFYDNLPLFDKFRAPSQMLVMLEFVGPILAAIGLAELVRIPKEAGGPSERLSRNFRYGAFAAVAFGLVVFAIEGAWTSAMGADPGLQQMFGGSLPPQVTEAVFSVVRLDWLLTALFAGGFCFLASAYLRGKLSTSLLTAAVILITIADLWRVDARAMVHNQPKDAAFAVFTETEADRIMKSDSTLFRMADLLRGPTHPAYHLHQHIGGYSAAKVRRYQDLMDVTAQGSTSIPGPGLAWDLLGAKYVHSQQPTAATDRQVGTNLWLRPTAMPRAWFVDRVEVREDKSILNAIAAGDFDPKAVAFVPEELGVDISPRSGDIAETEPVVDTDSPDATEDIVDAPDEGSGETEPVETSDAEELWTDPNVTVTSWRPHEIVIDAEANGTQFLVVSEIYYPPGWNAYLDGEPVETIRTNYLLRGIVVPEGKHTIHFLYESENHETGRMISLILNILVLGMIAVGLFLRFRRREDGAAEEMADSE